MEDKNVKTLNINAICLLTMLLFSCTSDTEDSATPDTQSAGDMKTAVDMQEIKPTEDMPSSVDMANPLDMKISQDISSSADLTDLADLDNSSDMTGTQDMADLSNSTEQRVKLGTDRLIDCNEACGELNLMCNTSYEHPILGKAVITFEYEGGYGFGSDKCDEKPEPTTIDEFNGQQVNLVSYTCYCI